MSFEFCGLRGVRARDPLAENHLTTTLRPLSPEELAPLLRGIGAGEAKLILRRRWVDISPGPQCPDTPRAAAVDAASAARARRAGRQVCRRIGWEELCRAVEDAAGRQLAEDAAFALARKRPRASALRRLTPAQGLIFALLALGAVGLGVAAPRGLGLALFGLFSVLFLAMAALRLQSLFTPLPKVPRRRLGEEELPFYSVLVPVYRETGVLRQLVAALGRLDYPADRLEILIICEADDRAVLNMLEAMELSAPFRLVRVPEQAPRTKPKALNHALHFVRGELLTIYDAEDIPEPGQLRAAAEAFAAAPPDVACLQARLAWYNAGESWISRMMAVEYAGHFEAVLPTMARMAMPLPLGGTSNHFRVAALRAAGGWDPHNVTEDADLGFRLARAGFRAGVLDSTTWEEACTTWRAWRAQRARWIKGWLQTWLVQMRAPLRFWRETGWRGAFALHALMGAGVMAALAHPFFVAWTLWELLPPQQAGGLLWHVQTSTSATVLAAGYGAAMTSAALGLHRRGMPGLWPWVLTLPAWWLLISAAAWLALWDFLLRPHHWRKTEHGLSAFLRGK